MDIYPTPAELIRDVPINQPIISLKPHSARCAVQQLCGHFPGETLDMAKPDEPRAALRRFLTREAGPAPVLSPCE
jgi:ornithine decarboxylase